MTKSNENLPEIDPPSLEKASGGQQMGLKWQGREGSTNILDCRGPTCLDSTGKVDEQATREHKRSRPPAPTPTPTPTQPPKG